MWEKAVNICSQHVKDRYVQTVKLVSQKLQGIRRFEAAGDLLRDIELYPEAIGCYVDGAHWQKARNLADERCPGKRASVDKAYHDQLRNAGDGQALVEAGNVVAGLDILAKKGEWDKVFEVGMKNCRDELPRFAAAYANKLVDEQRFADAVETLFKYGAPAGQEHFGLYSTVITHWTQRTEQDMGVDPDGPDRAAHDKFTTELREVVYKLVSALKSKRPSRGHGASYEGKGGGGGGGGGGLGSPMADALERALLVLHYSSLQVACRREKMLGLAAKLATGLLRFCGTLPADKAFFNAGMACRENGDLSQAFVFLNHYLDLTEAIDDGDATMMDNSDFVDTDIPSPVDYDLPKVQFLAEPRREEVRDWVLALSMDQKVEQALSTRPCKVGGGLRLPPSAKASPFIQMVFGWQWHIMHFVLVGRPAIVDCCFSAGCDGVARAARKRRLILTISSLPFSPFAFARHPIICACRVLQRTVARTFMPAPCSASTAKTRARPASCLPPPFLKWSAANHAATRPKPAAGMRSLAPHANARGVTAQQNQSTREDWGIWSKQVNPFKSL